jgi:hypothetical protein
MHGGCDDIDFAKEVKTNGSILYKKGISYNSMFTPMYSVLDPNGDIDPFPTIDAIRNAFYTQCPNRDIIFLSGHGSATGWGELNAGNLLAQTDPFGSTNPVVFASSCTTGTYPGFFSFAEAFLAQRASVYIGATKWGLGSHQWISGQLYYKWDIGETIGQAVKETKRSLGTYVFQNMFGQGGSITIQKPKEKYWNAIYHIFGDPKIAAPGSGALSSESSAQLDIQSRDDQQSYIWHISVPDFEVIHDDGKDYPEIPGGSIIAEPCNPLVPSFTVSNELPLGTRVLNVDLIYRNEPYLTTGWNIPFAIEAQGQSSSKPVDQQQSFNYEWFPQLDYSWTVTNNPDDITLSVTVNPFKYTAATTDSRFYSYYEFLVETAPADIRIVSLETPRPVYETNDAISLELLCRNYAETPNDVVVSTVILHQESGEIVSILPARTLEDLSGPFSLSFTWDTIGFEPGNYLAHVHLRDTAGRLLDFRSVALELGYPYGEITDFSPAQPAYEPGVSINLSLEFSNTGYYPLDGQAIFTVRNLAGEILDETTHDFQNLPTGHSQNFPYVLTSPSEPAYNITAHVLYNGQSTPPETLQVSHCNNGLLPGDLNFDCLVNLKDIARLAQYWLTPLCPTPADCAFSDVNHDNEVDFDDLALLAEYYLQCNNPDASNCSSN